jgi:hypothetical protein
VGQANNTLPEVAYYYPEPYWAMREGDWVKSLLLFFDQVAILLPNYMRGREIAADPVLAGPLTDAGILQVLEPESFVDKEMTEALSEGVIQLIADGAFDNLDRSLYYRALSRSRMGWKADVELSKWVIEELQRKDLAHEPQDGVSVPFHPVVRTTILVLLSQLARSAGRRRALDLQPVTSSREAVDGLRSTLSLSSMPSAGHIVTLDLQTVGLDLTTVPLDEILDFRRQHGEEYRSYARDVRKLIATLSPLPTEERDRLLADRQAELRETAHRLVRRARRRLGRPLASIALGGLGAAWLAAQDNVFLAAMALGTGIVGASFPESNAGAYSYLFAVKRRLSD